MPRAALSRAQLDALFALPIAERLAQSKRWRKDVVRQALSRASRTELASGPLYDLWPLQRLLWHQKPGVRTRLERPSRLEHRLDDQGSLCAELMHLSGNRDPLITTRLVHGAAIEVAHASAGALTEIWVVRLHLEEGRPVRAEAATINVGSWAPGIDEARWTFAWQRDLLVCHQIEPVKLTPGNPSLVVNPLSVRVSGKAVEVSRPGAREVERLTLR